MHPYLIEFHGIKIPAYGVFVALGFLAALTLGIRLAEKEGIPKEVFADLAFWILFSGILGGRIYYVLENIELFLRTPWEALFIWRGGLAIFGGLAGGVLGGVLYCRKKKLDVKKTADVAFTVLPLAQAIGRMGCFCAGCCYGKPCSLPWAVTFTNPESLARLGVPLHPTQIYHMLANLIIFAILVSRFNKRKFDGENASLYLILYPVGRFVIEFYRGDFRAFLGPLSLPQWFSLICFAVGIILYARLRG